MNGTSRAPGRAAVALLTAVYGVVMAVANARNDPVTFDLTSDWVLFRSPTDFPGDFGRQVFAGTMALGIVVVFLAAAVYMTAGRHTAVWIAGVAAAGAFATLVWFRVDSGFLGAKPSAGAVMLAVASYLGVSALNPRSG